MKDQNIYRKMDNGRYKPFGICYQPKHLSDGIWYVKHYDYDRGITSVPYIAGLFRVGDAKEIDIPTLCGMEDMCDKIFNSKEYKELTNGSYSINDLVHVCVKVIYDESKNKE